MNTPAFENLDLACAKQAEALAAQPSKELYKLITQALGVLEEQGVYALFLHLHAQKECDLEQGLYNFLSVTPQYNPLLKNGGKNFKAIQELAADLDSLLLAHDLLRQTLVYVRYHAKVDKDSTTHEEQS